MARIKPPAVLVAGAHCPRIRRRARSPQSSVGRSIPPRDDRQWSLRTVLSKTGSLYDPGAMWQELTPFLDALVLDGRPKTMLAERFRLLRGRPIFSFNDVTGCGRTWPTKVWRRHIGVGEHMVRALWHQLMHEEAADEQWIALALCGQSSPRTAEHYVVKGARIRAVRRARSTLQAARARRLVGPEGPAASTA
jgi:hypothetical protein